MRPGLRRASLSNTDSDDGHVTQWRTSGERRPQTPDQQGTCPYRELCRVARSPTALPGRGERIGQRKRLDFRAAVCPPGRRGSLLRALLHGHCARAISG